MNERKVLLREIVTDDAVEAGAEPLCKMLRRLRQFLRPHIVRRRVDEIAGEYSGFCRSGDRRDVDAVGRHQSGVGCIRLAVTAEPITAERESEDGETCIVWCIGETTDARRQQARQQTGPERIAEFAGLVVQAEEDLSDLSVRRGQREECAGFCGKAITLREL